MLCRLFFQIYIKIKTEITEIDIAERHQRADNQIKTEITEIDIAESKIQLKRISLQPNSREGEGTYRTQEREKEPTEPKRRDQLNSRERERRNQPNSREGEPSEAPQAMYYSR